MPSTSVIFQQLGISLLLGLLVGLQRERTEAGMPGLRTFPLIAVLGTICGLLGVKLGGWAVVAGFLGVLAVLIFPNLVRLREAHPDPGITTDVAALLMYAVGAFLAIWPDQMGVAVAVGGGVAVLLEYKPELHRLAGKLGDQDLKAIMQFVLISCVILPVLPNKDFYLGVLNPRETWFMVVLIVAMSLGGYIAYKFLGRDAGILLGGIMGGAISSTATTVSYSRQTRSTAADAGSAAVVIMIASTMVFLRVLIEVSVVAPVFLGRLAAPILVMMTLMLLPSTAMWYRIRRRPSLMPQQHNPTQLTSALWFGAMYALVLLALAWIKQHVGDQWLYPVAAFSGLTDMDAITLSTARMFRSASADSWIASEGWKLVLTAALSNLAFKTLMVGLLGTRTLLCQVALLYSIPFFAGLAILFLW